MYEAQSGVFVYVGFKPGKRKQVTTFAYYCYYYDYVHSL